MQRTLILSLLLSCSLAFGQVNELVDPGFEGIAPPDGAWLAPLESVTFSGTHGALTGSQAAILESSSAFACMLAQAWNSSPPDDTTYRVGVRAKATSGATGYLAIYAAQGTDDPESVLVAYPNGDIELQSPPGTVVFSTSGADFSSFRVLSLIVTTDGTDEAGVVFVKELGTSGAWVLDDAFVYEVP